MHLHSFVCQATVMPAFKKRYEKILTLQLSTWRGQLRFRDSKVTLFHRNIVLPHKKFLTQHWRWFSLCNVTDKNEFLFLYAFKATFLEATQFLRVEVQNWSIIKPLFRLRLSLLLSTKTQTYILASNSLSCEC